MAPRCGAGHCGCGGRAPPPEQSQARCDPAHLGPARCWTRWASASPERTDSWAHLGSEAPAPWPARCAPRGHLPPEALSPAQPPRTDAAVEDACALRARPPGSVACPRRGPAAASGLDGASEPLWLRLPRRDAEAQAGRGFPRVSQSALLPCCSCSTRAAATATAAAAATSLQRPEGAGPAPLGPPTSHAPSLTRPAVSRGQAGSSRPVAPFRALRSFETRSSDPPGWPRPDYGPGRGLFLSNPVTRLLKIAPGSGTPASGRARCWPGKGSVCRGLGRRDCGIGAGGRRGGADLLEPAACHPDLIPTAWSHAPGCPYRVLSPSPSWYTAPFSALTSGGTREAQLGVPPTCLDTS